MNQVMKDIVQCVMFAMTQKVDQPVIIQQAVTKVQDAKAVITIIPVVVAIRFNLDYSAVEVNHSIAVYSIIIFLVNNLNRRQLVYIFLLDKSFS